MQPRPAAGFTRQDSQRKHPAHQITGFVHVQAGTA
jgi:hypothetical protein